MCTGDDDWMRRAWCARVPDLPWRSDVHTVPGHLVEQMTAICGACPVRRECAGYVDTAGIDGGFWAGADRASYWEPVYARDGRQIAEQAVIPIDPIGDAA